jgi:hypothetical protein
LSGSLLLRKRQWIGQHRYGSPPKRRTVLTIPEMDWIVGVLEHWVSEVRPLLAPGRTALASA